MELASRGLEIDPKKHEPGKVLHTVGYPLGHFQAKHSVALISIISKKIR